MTTHDSQSDLANSSAPPPIAPRPTPPTPWKDEPPLVGQPPRSTQLPTSRPTTPPAPAPTIGQKVPRPTSPPHSLPPEPLPKITTINTANVEPTRTATKNADEDENDDDETTTDELRYAAVAAAYASPPWLVSLALHMAVLIVLSLLFLPLPLKDRISLEMLVSDQTGEQLVDDTLDFGMELPNTSDSVTLTPIDLPPVDDPLAAPAPLAVQPDAPLATGEFVTPNIGIALTGREIGMKRTLLTVYGGNKATESAVTEALKWLQRNQRKDGSWSLVGPYSNGSTEENFPSATAMALLAFQGAGHTHRAGTYKEEVAKAWRYLIKHQDKDGTWPTPVSHHHLYTHAQVTIALCELYGMTHDDDFRDAALKALDYAIESQAANGGWRYYPKQDGDMSVTGWFVMAFQSALMAGLRAPSPTLEKVNQFLDSVSNTTGDRYSYLPSRPSTPAMTAEGLLCRQYLGWKRDDPRLQSGAEHILANPIEYRQQNVYYWYYATQVLHHLEGPAWEEWNAVMRDVIPSQQVTSGPERGSWEPDGDEWGSLHGGRLFTTCLSTYMLEVYYRHLPIYGIQLN